MKRKLLFSVAAVVATVPLVAAIADNPPVGTKQVVEIIEQLEQQGYGPFTEVSFDDGYWEVEVYKQDMAYELSVDAHTGRVLSEYRDEAEPRPPAGAQPLSRILRGLEKSGYTTICEASFERRYWEIEVLHRDGKHEILVDPKSGEIVSDRLDD